MHASSSISLILNNALASELDVIGDRWTLLILRDIFIGRTRFEALRIHTGASKATLSRRLESLIEAGIVRKSPATDGGKRLEYQLTSKGGALFGASMLAWQWESQWFDCADNDLPHTLYHRDCGQILQPKAVCQHCKQDLHLKDVEWPQSGSHIEQQMEVIRSSNKQRRVRSGGQLQAADPRMTQISDLVGDRWTLLLLIAAFLGIRRNDGFANQLGIASNILSQRLNVLVEADIFSREPYQTNPPRYEYQLTDKAKSLFPLIMVLRQWAMVNQGQQESLIHKPCGHALSIDIVCGSCEEPTLPGAIYQ